MIALFLLISYPFNYIYPGNGVCGRGMMTYYTLEGTMGLWWNPASFPESDFSISGEWNDLLGLFNETNLGVSGHNGRIYLWMGFSNFSSGNMPLNPEIEDSSELPESTGVFASEEKAYIISIGSEWKNLKFGIGMKLFQQDILGSRGIGYGFDIGCIYKMEKINVALVIKDPGNTGISWGNRIVDDIPSSYILALSRTFSSEHWNLTPEISLRYQEKLNFSTGFEFKLWHISIRSGWSKRDGFGAGFGVLLKGIQINYAFNPSDFGISHRISITFTKGGVNGS